MTIFSIFHVSSSPNFHYKFALYHLFVYVEYRTYLIHCWEKNAAFKYRGIKHPPYCRGGLGPFNRTPEHEGPNAIWRISIASWHSGARWRVTRKTGYTCGQRAILALYSHILCSSLSTAASLPSPARPQAVGGAVEQLWAYKYPVSKHMETIHQRLRMVFQLLYIFV